MDQCVLEQELMPLLGGKARLNAWQNYLITHEMILNSSLPISPMISVLEKFGIHALLKYLDTGVESSHLVFLL